MKWSCVANPNKKPVRLGHAVNAGNRSDTNQFLKNLSKKKSPRKK